MNPTGDRKIPPPWRDQGVWIGLPLLCVGLLFFAHQLRSGVAAPVASLLVILAGLGAPATRWKQAEKFVGWRLHYMVLQFVIGFAVILAVAYARHFLG